MTREEAIHILDNLKPTNTKSSFDAYVVGEAITMAIKALEQNESAKEWYKLFVEKLEQEPILDKIKKELLATAEMHEDGDYYLRDKWVSEIIDKYREQDCGCKMESEI